MSIRDISRTTVAAELADGTQVKLVRMSLRRWAELAGEIRAERLKEEAKAVSAVKDPVIAQQLRLRASLFEPNYWNLVDDSQTPTGMIRVLEWSAMKAGTDQATAERLADELQPLQLQQIINEIVDAPLGQSIGGNVSEGQSANPTSAESSNPATGESVPTPGSENASTSTGTESVCEFGPPSDSTPST